MKKRKKYIYGIKEVQGLPDGTHLHLSCYEWEGETIVSNNETEY